VALRANASLKEVAIVVGDALRRHGIHAVLTGGACASIYTGGRYSSVDADFVLAGETKRAQLDAAMASLGFVRERDRYVHPSLAFFVEFPRGPLAIGADHRVRPVQLTSRGKRALALSPTDSCRDRLAAFYHWDDLQSLDVAAQIATRHRLKWTVMRAWSDAEGSLEKFEEFRRAVVRRRHHQRRSS